MNRTVESPPPLVHLGRRGRFAGGVDGRLPIIDLHSPHVLRTDMRPDIGGGDIGDVRLLFDRTVAEGMRGTYLQFNPITDSGWDECPYSSLSNFSLTPAYADLDRIPQLQDSGIFHDLREKQMQWHAKQDSARFHHGAQRAYKLNALRIAYDRLPEERFAKERDAFGAYREHCDPEVKMYAVFHALKEINGGRPWWEWNKKNTSGDIEDVLREHSGDGNFRNALEFTLYTQHVLDQQWSDLTKHMQEHDGGLILDHPYSPNPDSAMVWGHQNLYHLNKDGTLRYASGCCDDGKLQNWGGAVHRFNDDAAITGEVIALQVKMLKHLSRFAKIIRLDHFAAYGGKYFVIDTRNPRHSHYEDALKHRLLQEVVKECPDVHFYVEDTGVDWLDQQRVRTHHGMAGMRVMQWPPYEPGAGNADPYHHPVDSVGQLQGHDTAPFSTVWQHMRNEHRNHFRGVMNGDWNFERGMQASMNSKAELSTVTGRELDEDPRWYNVMGTKHPENWSARMRTPVEQLNLARLSEITHDAKRGVGLVLGTDPILAALPGINAERHCAPGGKMSVRIALRPGVLPTSFSISTTAPVVGVNGNGEWPRMTIAPDHGDVTCTGYKGGVHIYEISLQISPDALRGCYRLAGSVKTNGTESQLCLPGEDIGIVVT